MGIITKNNTNPIIRMIRVKRMRFFGVDIKKCIIPEIRKERIVAISNCNVTVTNAFPKILWSARIIGDITNQINVTIE
jgi:hypothetical protein